MRIIKSIKQQTFALVVGLTLGLSVVFSSLAVITAFMVEDMLLSNVLEQRAAYIEQYYRRNGNLPTLADHNLQLFPRLDDVPSWANERMARNQLSGEIFTPDKSHYHYRKLALGENSGYLLVEVSSLLVVTNQFDILFLFLIVLIAVVCLAVWLAVRFSRKIVNPVLALTEAVLVNEQLTEKIPLPMLQFELGYLSNVLQESFNRLHLLLEREKAFATNVSHELRTPLTILKNSGALIAHRGFNDEDLISIQTSCDHMEHTIDVLLALARAESLEFQSCNVKAVLAGAIGYCHKSLPGYIDVQLVLPNELTLMANRRLLELLFINLLRNVSEHASEAVLRVTGEAQRLIFENQSNAHPSALITQAGVKSLTSRGIGQGLYLVARIAEHFGWQFTVEHSEDAFRAIINLPNR